MENAKKDVGKAGISVLMSIYKNEKLSYFRAAMDSILGQTRLPDEIVLMEDGPLPEELEEQVRRYEAQYDFLKVYRIEQNVQLGRALGRGVELCRYELVARMDTDDIAVRNRLEIQQKYMEEWPEIAVTGGWMNEFTDDESYKCVKKMPEYDAAIKEYGKYRCPVNHMTVMFRRKDVLECGNYQHFPNLEDYHLWSRMMADGKKFYNIPQVLVNARTNTSVYSRRGGFGYFKRYLTLRKMQKEIGLLSFREYVYSIFGTAVMTLVPDSIRLLIYRKILRKDKGGEDL